MIKRQDYIFLLALIGVVTFLVIPFTHELFFTFTDEFLLIGGFFKFFLFASIGDVLSRRIRFHDYKVTGLLWKMMVWGIIGVFVVLVFQIFPAGVETLQANNILPFEGNIFMFALFTSVLMNAFFAPTMMLFHRITDQIIESRIESSVFDLKSTLKAIDYPAFIGMLMRTIPLFWIPAHTITFLLNETYRPFFAALLGVMLGLFLNLYKKRA